MRLLVISKLRENGNERGFRVSDKAKAIYKEAMDEWKAASKQIARLVLRVFPWKGPRFLTNEERTNIATQLTKAISQILERQAKFKSEKEEEKQIEGKMRKKRVFVLVKKQGKKPETKVPFYDINFELFSPEQGVYELVLERIVMIEEVFGIYFPKRQITDFENYSFTSIREYFGSSIEKYEEMQKMKKLREQEEEKQKKPLAKSKIRRSASAKQMENPPTTFMFNFKELIGEEDVILSPAIVEQIQLDLPTYLRKMPWKLLYSSLKHGISLKT